MTEDLANMEADLDPDVILPGSEPEHGSAERANRLRQAVKAAGGGTAVSKRAGMPLGTLTRYQAGREMKAGAMIALAEATGVRLEWLATGTGPMRAGDAAPAADSPPSAARPPRLFSIINADRLGAAYAGARQALASRGQHDADPVRVMQITALIYDSLTETEENPALARTNPQDDPQG
jgi:hypothetical protein